MNINNEGKKIILSNKLSSLNFSKIVRSSQGYLCGLNVTKITKKDEFSTLELSTRRKRTIDTNTLHVQLGHPYKETVKKKQP